MGNILLTSAEYNDLYRKGKEEYIDGSKELLECKIVEDNTCIILDEDDKIIAQFDVNRPETNIFRDLTDCLFEIKISCDEQSLGITRECEWCINELGCCKRCSSSFDKINNIRFVDPIQYRSKYTYDKLLNLRNKINGPEIKSDCDEIKEINKTIKKLSKQLDAIIKKWEY